MKWGHVMEASFAICDCVIPGNRSIVFTPKTETCILQCDKIICVICLVQNMFYQGKESRTMSLNTQYLVLFKSPRDKQQISILSRQMYPNRSH